MLLCLLCCVVLHYVVVLCCVVLFVLNDMRVGVCVLIWFRFGVGVVSVCFGCV